MAADQTLGSRLASELSKDLRELREHAELLQAHEGPTVDPLLELQKEVVRLRRRKAALHLQLTSEPVALRLEARAARAAAVDTSPTPAAVVDADFIDAIDLSAKRRQLFESQLGYRLAGQTLFTLRNGRTGVRFDTMHDGRFFEQYYVILGTDDQGRASVYRHSLPSFVPLAALAPLLASDVNRFLRRVSDLLNAFVSRRQQVKVLSTQAADFLREDLQCSASVDFVALNLRGADGAVVTLQLVFEDMVSTRPSRCVAKAKDPDNPAVFVRLRAEERLFLELPLATAFATAFPSDMATDFVQDQ